MYVLFSHDLRGDEADNVGIILQITSSERHLHIASADGAPGFEGLVKDMIDEFGAPHVRGLTDVLVPVVMDEYTSDWDIIYPFSNVRLFPFSFVMHPLIIPLHSS